MIGRGRAWGGDDCRDGPTAQGAVNSEERVDPLPVVAALERRISGRSETGIAPNGNSQPLRGPPV